MNAAVSSQHNTMSGYRDIFEQYHGDASFLWLLRTIAVNQPHYKIDDIKGLERRIEAHLDGLMTAPDDAWEICKDAMVLQEPGEMFTSSVLAFRSLDVTKIQAVVEAGMATEATVTGLVSALGWLPGRLCHSWIKKFLTSKDINHKYLAIAACSVRREDPREYLTNIFQREDCLAHQKLYARSLRLVGELKRRDLSPALRIALNSDNPEILFWACWSGILLGDKTLVDRLQSFVLEKGPFQEKAIQLVFRALPVEQARTWITQMAKQPEQTRNIIKATAILGDPHAINWLIAQMRVPALSQLAGEAFTTITGIDLEANMLAIDDLPDLDHQLPNDNPEDDNVDLDEDEHLPFPDVDKVGAVWQKYQQRFMPGQRYLLGKLIASDSLEQIFMTGFQRQRCAAALELALLEPSKMLMNHAIKSWNEA